MSDNKTAGEDFDALVFDEDWSAEKLRAPLTSGRPISASNKISEYNEVAYLATYPEVQAGIVKGDYTSGLEHYVKIGRQERRLDTLAYLHELASGAQEVSATDAQMLNIDAVIVSTSGTVFVVGWCDDRDSRLLSISVIQGEDGWNTRGVARCRREDVEELLQVPLGPSYGFWLVHKIVGFNAHRRPVILRARFADGKFSQVETTPKVVTDDELREIALGHFASLQYHGNRDMESFQELDTGAGASLIILNRTISTSITRAAHVERYGPAKSKFLASFIVCLFGKLEYFFLQNALFATGTNLSDVEFIYVSNSPELAEALQKEAKISERIYGISLVLVTLPGNAGFSAANNIAATFARSDRIVFINPDVFPRDNHWVTTHNAILAERPLEQTALFGAPLYYDDGSLMHGGMYFEIDRGLSVKSGEIKATGLIRTEHYGKGAPAWSDRYTGTRAVPAVTGAFISADRAWFESLGGFTEDYLFGHYEDADLCLKSLQRGVASWLQDIRFWHLEGKGSIRRPPHEGGSLVNRWAFTRKWGKFVEASLAGRSPRHPLLNGMPGRTFEQIRSLPNPPLNASASDA